MLNCILLGVGISKTTVYYTYLFCVFENVGWMMMMGLKKLFVCDLLLILNFFLLSICKYT